MNLRASSFQDEWKVDMPSDLLEGIRRFEERSDTLGIMFRIARSKHEVREHYRIYDTNSFIADIGGYLGLLLGHSLFGIYWSVQHFIFARVAKL